MQMQIQRFALVTGCSEGGIGYALAQEFQGRGVHVFATARTVSKMRPLEGLANVTLLHLDITSESSINDAVAIVCKHTNGTLDYLVNNAGCAYTMPMLDLDNKLAREMFDVNFWGVFALIQAFAPLIIAAKGTIANMASVGTLFNPPYMGTYASSKAACEVLSEGIRRELAPFGVKVVTIMQGAIATTVHNDSPMMPLPEGSLYTTIAKEFEDRIRGKGVVTILGSRDVFAKRVVSDLLKGATGRIYRGNLSTVMTLLENWLPEWIMDRLAVSGTGLATLSRHLSHHESF